MPRGLAGKPMFYLPLAEAITWWGLLAYSLCRLLTISCATSATQQSAKSER